MIENDDELPEWVCVVLTCVAVVVIFFLLGGSCSGISAERKVRDLYKRVSVLEAVQRAPADRRVVVEIVDGKPTARWAEDAK